eukprot:CAMPEP_0169100982 /NCGR_PEP_ID=MMETSP1015-20121227/21386_1 /TAXON_ID=342587 /ORGANISM="Karlodinium micrum, Strain CCMP2283" /LENGTH=632 /DNA_ID=CAMNT_0009161977 /DNA_START=25 /DNA_END=1924 /DNA_ORIENTATION=-
MASSEPVEERDAVPKGGAIWRALKDRKLVDPSMAPTTAEEHKRRLENTEWGPFWASLSPVDIVAGSALGNITVKDMKFKDTLDVPFHMTIPWYEGLFVLDTMNSCGVQATWLDDFLVRLLKFARAKEPNEEFRCAEYVKNRLMETAITGPSFLDANGKEHKHRRSKMRKTKPARGSTTRTRFACRDLVGYLPAWEAVLHKKCGLYQEFYLVHWEDNTSNLQDTESGSHISDCSWEPDECVPDDMDVYRMRAKKAWLKEATKLDRDMVFKPPLTLLCIESKPPPKRFYVESEECVQQKQKIMKMTVNQKGYLISSDFYNPFKKHGWEHGQPRDEDRTQGERKIASGWPKKISDYPKGYGPANPPGCCNEKCDCMKDWLLGQSYEEREQDRSHNQHRALKADAGIQQLIHSKRARKLGDDTYGQRYLAPTSLSISIDTNQFRKDAARMKEITFSAIRELAEQIPIRAFQRDDSASLCEVLVPAVVFVRPNGTLMPSRYNLIKSLPWLAMEPSGELHITAAPPELPAGGSQTIAIQLTFDNIPSEVVTEEFNIRVTNIGPEKDQETQLLRRLTKNVLDAMSEMWVMPRLRRSLEARLNSVCDCATGALKEPSLGTWIQAMKEAAQVAQVCSIAHV